MHNITATENRFCKTVNRMAAFYRCKLLGGMAGLGIFFCSFKTKMRQMGGACKGCVCYTLAAIEAEFKMILWFW